MRRRLGAALALLLAVLPASARELLGANLNLIADFTRNHEFVDVMRQSREFGSFADPFNTVIAVGADGWPTGDFGVTLMAAQAGVRGLAGTYKVVFNGRATVTAAGSGSVANTVHNAANNETRLDLVFPADGDTMALRFAVEAGSAVKNLRVIRPGFNPDSHPTFTPTWLAHVSRFRVLRLMDWLSTNDRANAIVSWADRPTLEKKRTEAEGARWETIVDLANTVNRDIWINIPVRANDEYVRNLATLLRDGLEPNIKVYVEYSNELWNGAFEQFHIQRDLAAAEAAASGSPLRFDGATDPNTWAFRRVAKRLKEISDIFRSVWGSAAMNTRVRPVLAGQMANSFIVSQGFEVVEQGMNTAPGSVFHAIGGAPYIFPSATNDAAADEAPGLGVEQILAGIAAGVANAPREDSYQYEAHASLGAWYGLKVLAYEGGFDTFGAANIAAKRAANLDPRIRNHCRNLIDAWHAAGFDEFLWFNAGAASYETPFGAWPLLEDLQDAAQPKNQCMDDVLAAAVPALNLGLPITAPIAGGAFQGSNTPAGEITNAAGAFGFPGYAQYLLRVEQAGTYRLTFRAQGSSVPRVGVQLNGATVSAAFALPEGAAFADSQALTLTLRRGLNALRLTRPANAGQWTIQSFAISAGDAPAAPANHTALWWNPAESGWGINIAQQGSIVFATLFTYAPDGRDLWLVATATQQGDGSFTGSLLQTTGPAFNTQPWTAISSASVGTLTLRFSAADRGSLQYTVNGAAVAKAIEKQPIGVTAPVCTDAPVVRAGESNYTDLWFNPAESGWGINLTHQGSVIFATLFTYAADAGRNLWLVGANLARQADGSFAGDLFRTSGPAFNASPWGAISVSNVGTMRLQFANGETGTLTYSFNGVTVTKPIIRQVFGTTAPVCR